MGFFGGILNQVADAVKPLVNPPAQTPAAPAAQAPAPTLGQLDQQRAEAGQVNAVPRQQQLTPVQKIMMMQGNMNDEEFNKLIAPLGEETRRVMLEQRQRYLDAARSQGSVPDQPTMAQLDQQRLAQATGGMYGA